MRIGLLMVFILVPMMCSNAQNWNPYVTKGDVNADPLLPVELEGNGILLFNIGNDGNKPLKLVKNQEMTIIISLSNGLPNHVDPQLSITGTWEDKFNWSYQKPYKTYVGVQNQELPALSEGTLGVNFKATINSRKSNPSNGINVNIQPPPYSNGDNLTEDDNVSIYTYVGAKDFGDAPFSYGVAAHQINTFKTIGTNEYENYLYLGDIVDAETIYQESSMADADDFSLTNDEDGVFFPELIQGETVEIPVIVTVYDYGVGILNAWFDWNGDGDFDEENEKLESPINVFKSGIVNISVVIPENATTKEVTFARFRLGDFNVNSPVSESAWGEVEDYQIKIEPSKRLEISKIFTKNHNNNQSSKISLNDEISCSITITNTGSTNLNNIIISDNKINLRDNACLKLAPGETYEISSLYKITPIDLDKKSLTSTITVYSDETKPISEKILIFSNIK